MSIAYANKSNKPINQSIEHFITLGCYLSNLNYFELTNQDDRGVIDLRA